MRQKINCNDNFEIWRLVRTAGNIFIVHKLKRNWNSIVQFINIRQEILAILFCVFCKKGIRLPVLNTQGYVEMVFIKQSFNPAM